MEQDEFHDSEVEDLKDQLIDVLDKDKKEIKYKTNEVAQLLNVSPQLIRNYCKEFKDYLGEIKRDDANNYRYFSMDDIRKLDKVIDLCVRKKMSYTSARDVLYNGKEAGLSLREGDMQYIKNLYDQILTTAHLQEQTAAHLDTIKKEYFELKARYVTNEFLEEKREKEISTLSGKLDTIIELYNMTREENETLRDKMDEMNKSLQELSNKNVKRKGILGIFKKD